MTRLRVGGIREVPIFKGRLVEAIRDTFIRRDLLGIL